ncbi:MAG: exodeoxyribonuclease VII large subunit [Odoribacteraceae bacterium]|jgi:exodeoxyribonuclease VII large subunit|nr:exodeoxyribonuclease VII large subunit [Odoribacteraceae bacterium]
MEAIGLYQLNCLVKQALKKELTGSVWVVAEIADIKENRSGHCYLELIEKREGDNALVASARATIWASVYRVLKPAFEVATGRALQCGLKVLLAIEVSFHEIYGYSLNVREIDPSFTVGDLERARREILDRLTREGVIDMNRSLPFPLLPKTIAVISSPTAAGYEDFAEQLRTNTRGYAFHVRLFPAIMQGEKSAESVIKALERVYDAGEIFDAVVIIRGGGSQTDLSCFDSYELALNVAGFPLPVITGIGHERDESLVDRVAYKPLKTPTAAAAFLVEAFGEADDLLEERQARFIEMTGCLLQQAKQRQMTYATAVKQLTRSSLERRASRLSLLSQKLGRNSQLLVQHHVNLFMRLNDLLKGRLAARFDRHATRLEEIRRETRGRVERTFFDRKRLLELAETKAIFADPRRVLACGYSIARVNGKVLRSVTCVKGGEIVEIELLDGRVESEIKRIKNN